MPASELTKGDVIRFPVAKGMAVALVEKAEPCDLQEVGGYGQGMELDLKFQRAHLIATHRLTAQTLTTEHVSARSVFERRVV